MKRSYPIIIMVGIFVFGACNQENKNQDKEGMQMLSEARALLQQGKIDAARDTILSLRKKYPFAVEARRQAILTMDSIELQGAKDSAIDLKIEFYTRKLELDKTNYLEKNK